MVTAAGLSRGRVKGFELGRGGGEAPGRVLLIAERFRQVRTRARKFHLPARAPASHPRRPRCAPKSSAARRERPGCEETNPSGVSPGPGGDGAFGCRKPGFRMGQGDKHGKLQPKGAAEPLGRPRKRTLDGMTSRNTQEDMWMNACGQQSWATSDAERRPIANCARCWVLNRAGLRR